MNDSVWQYIKKHAVIDININAYELQTNRKYTFMYIPAQF